MKGVLRSDATKSVDVDVSPTQPKPWSIDEALELEDRDKYL